MLYLISPAKTLDFESSSFTDRATQPVFLEESAALIEIMKTFSAKDLAKMMSVSEKIATLNEGRFHEWQSPFTLQNAKQAAFAFKGDVYTGLAVETLAEEGIAYLQEHLRILSGLYGLLKPLDLMQAYRLEMGTRVGHPDLNDLYSFWGDKITDEINKSFSPAHNYLINLASNEYFKAVNTKKLDKPVITPVFKDAKNGQYKIISFYAKKARGLMVRYAADNEIKYVDDLKSFDYQGYRFDEKESTEFTWVYKRAEQ